MLYICKCGKWILSLGIAEAFTKAAGATYKQPCPDCSEEMKACQPDDKIKIKKRKETGKPTVLSAGMHIPKTPLAGMTYADLKAINDKTLARPIRPCY